MVRTFPILQSRHYKSSLRGKKIVVVSIHTAGAQFLTDQVLIFMCGMKGFFSKLLVVYVYNLHTNKFYTKSDLPIERRYILGCICPRTLENAQAGINADNEFTIMVSYFIFLLLTVTNCELILYITTSILTNSDTCKQCFSVYIHIFLLTN